MKNTTIIRPVLTFLVAMAIGAAVLPNNKVGAQRLPATPEEQAQAQAQAYGKPYIAPTPEPGSEAGIAAEQAAQAAENTRRGLEDASCERSIDQLTRANGSWEVMQAKGSTTDGSKYLELWLNDVTGKRRKLVIYRADLQGGPDTSADDLWHRYGALCKGDLVSFTLRKEVGTNWESKHDQTKGSRADNETWPASVLDVHFIPVPRGAE